MCFSDKSFTFQHSCLLLLPQLAVDLVKKKEAHIGGGCQPIISRAGLAANAGTRAAAKPTKCKSDKKH